MKQKEGRDWKLYAVAGRPVAHSRSPQMHNAAFGALGMDAAYVRLAAADAAGALGTAAGMGLSGMNVTAPFKEDMAGLVDRMDEEAESIGAVNTVIFSDGRAKGRNTDIYGVRTALEENGVLLRGAGAVVLGAGGAAKAAARALLSAGAEVTIANRTADKARGLAKSLGCAHCPLAQAELAKPMAAASVVVSSLDTAERVVSQDLLRRSMAILEAKYDRRTALREDAERTGCRIIDGREWLLHQGAKAFTAFTGKDAPVAAMRKALYAEEPAAKPNVALIGFMGSGKTTVAGEISRQAGMEVASTDAEVERKAGMPIRQIFATKGEDAFRLLESEAARSLAAKRRSVIDCGGGLPVMEGNRMALRQAAAVVWLWAGKKEIMRRVPADGTRPLLSVPEPGGRVEELLSQRMRHYAEASDIVIDTERMKAAEAARRILDEIHIPR